ncbi:hypothetical protein ACW4YW_15200 [Methylobacillus pratensis]
MAMDQDEQKHLDAATRFEREVYDATVMALRNGVRASIIIDNLHHHAKVVQSACELHRNVTGNEMLYP